MKSPLILKKVWPGFTQILHLFYRVEGSLQSVTEGELRAKGEGLEVLPPFAITISNCADC